MKAAHRGPLIIFITYNVYDDPAMVAWFVKRLHPSGHMDPDQVPALELLSRAASSVGTEGTTHKEWS